MANPRGRPKCNLCHEPIIWAKTAASGGKKSMPVNAEPNPAGNAWFENGLLVVASGTRPKPDKGRFFKPHFLTCEPYIARQKLKQKLRPGPADEPI